MERDRHRRNVAVQVVLRTEAEVQNAVLVTTKARRDYSELSRSRTVTPGGTGVRLRASERVHASPGRSMRRRLTPRVLRWHSLILQWISLKRLLTI